MQMKAGDAMQMDGVTDPSRHLYSYLQCIAIMVGETHKDDMVSVTRDFHGHDQ